MSDSREPFLSFSRISPSQAAGVDDRPRLYCFPYAGGSASAFAPWARALSPAIVVLGVELPGHGSRFDEQPLDRVQDMAAFVADAIASTTSTAPFALYGHSLGAIVAFETAKRLLQPSGTTPAQSRLAHLFIGAARAPHLPPVLPPIHHLPREEFLASVQQRYGGLPAALFEELELLEMVLPVLRADFTAYETYQHSGSTLLACPITAFHGLSDPVVREAAVGEWSRLTEGDFRLELVEGDHFFLNTSRDRLLGPIGHSLTGISSAAPSNEALSVSHYAPMSQKY